MSNLLICLPKAVTLFQPLRYFNTGALMTVDAESVVEFMMADEQHQNMLSYLERGRKFETATGQYLDEQFIAEMRLWAETPPPWEPVVNLDDIVSEAALRKHNLPFAPVKGYLEHINEVMKAFPRNEEACDAVAQKQVERHVRAKALEN